MEMNSTSMDSKQENRRHGETDVIYTKINTDVMNILVFLLLLFFLFLMYQGPIVAQSANEEGFVFQSTVVLKIVWFDLSKINAHFINSLVKPSNATTIDWGPSKLKGMLFHAK